MEIEIRKATLEDIELLMEWRMEVLHEVSRFRQARTQTNWNRKTAPIIKGRWRRKNISLVLPAWRIKLLAAEASAFIGRCLRRIIQPGNAPI